MSGNSDPECLDTFLFDLDGTLIDSIELIFRCYRHAAATHLSEQPPTSVWRDGLGTPLREQFRAVTSDADLIETMVVTYREFHNEHHDSSVSVYPDVEEVLRGLRRRAKLGVVTSKLRAGAERGLKLLGLFEFFDVVVTADEVEHPKPHSEPVETAIERLGASASRSIFIGDSPHDIASGRGAGVKTAGVLWGPFERDELLKASPDFLLESPKKILDL